jgi:spermidine/putrescine transport system ATP-binding protein
MTLALEVRGLTKRFGRAAAVNGVDLAVAPGLFVTLLGPSGCGKSTLLRAVAGFAPPEAGTVKVAGADITHAVPHRRPVTMVFQDYALFPHMTVGTNIGFGCEMKGIARPAVAARVAAMLALVRLDGMAARYPDQLSGGQRQRVALARALAPDPVLLLLDEPLAALDLQLRRDMQAELKSIQRQTGKTFLFVTHDQEEAMAMSDLVAVMRDGRIEQIGPPEAVYRDPANAFVAGFLGAANLVPVRVAAVDGGAVTVAADGLCWTLPRDRVTSAEQPVAGGAAVLMIRPESLRPLPAGVPDAPLAVTARVVERTFLGGRVQFGLQLAGGTTLRAELPPAEAAGVGAEVRLAPQAAGVALLAGTTGSTSISSGR